MLREKVYEIIDSERAYQDKLPKIRTDGRKHTVGEFLIMMQHYMNRAVEHWTLTPSDAMALDDIRKIAGICVKCMEEHGANPRQE